MSDVFSGEFYFDPDFPIFNVHFPGYPVVPGSMIVDKFISETQKITGYRLEDIVIKDFKFKRFISPGNYRYSILKKRDRYSCILYNNIDEVVTGNIFIKYGRY